jgi:hypothetical protein
MVDLMVDYWVALKVALLAVRKVDYLVDLVVV